MRKRIKRQQIREREQGRILEKDEGSGSGEGEKEEGLGIKIRERYGDDGGGEDKESWKEEDNMEIEENQYQEDSESSDKLVCQIQQP